MRFDYSLRPEELYFLAIELDAEFMDYEYFAAMDGIQKNYELHKIRALQGLEDRGLIEEDFSGKMSIDEDFSEVLRPVFFGRTECNIDLGEERYKLHVLDGQMTLACLKDRVDIRRTDADQLGHMLEGMEIVISCSDVDRGVYTEKIRASEANRANLRKSIDKITRPGW